VSSYEASVATNFSNLIPGFLDSLNNPERHVEINCNLCRLFVECVRAVYDPLLQISRVMAPYRYSRLFPGHIEVKVWVEQCSSRAKSRGRPDDELSSI